MPITAEYAKKEPARDTIAGTKGALVLEFGAPWCGICKAAQPLIGQALNAFPEVAHVKVEDGSGRPLGRFFRIKLWPTLVFLRDGEEVSRVVRPSEAGEIENAIRQITVAR